MSNPSNYLNTQSQSLGNTLKIADAPETQFAVLWVVVTLSHKFTDRMPIGELSVDYLSPNICDLPSLSLEEVCAARYLYNCSITAMHTLVSILWKSSNGNPEFTPDSFDQLKGFIKEIAASLIEDDPYARSLLDKLVHEGLVSVEEAAHFRVAVN